jgi:phage/plasmid-associated DNA primase
MDNLSFNKFLQNDFFNDETGNPHFLCLQEENGFMKGTKSNITKDELYKLQEVGEMSYYDKINKKDKKYKIIPLEQSTHYELLLRHTGNIVCIDVDGFHEEGLKEVIDIKDDAIAMFGDYPFTLSRKKKLPHYFIRLTGINLNDCKNEVDIFKHFKGDILVNHVWEKKNNEIINYFGNIPEVKYDDLLPLLKKDIRPKEKKNTLTNTTYTCNEQADKFIDIINIEYLSNYSDWCKIIWAGKACKISKDFLITISKKANNYSDDGFDNVYNSYDEPRFTLGTIKYYARLSNKDKYYELISNEFDVTKRSDYDYATFYSKMYGDNYIFRGGELYCFYKNKWRLDDKNRLLKHDIQNNLLLFVNKEIKKVSNFYNNKVLTADEIKTYKEKLEELGKYSMGFTSVSKLNQISENFINIINANQVDNENYFDDKPYLFCFNNKNFNLLTSKEVEISKEDYITENTHYDYEECTKEQIEKIDELFTQIFPNPEIRKCYLSVLFMGLTGVRLERFFLLNGCGRNGKGLINELYAMLLGDDYYYKLPVDVLTSKMNLSSGANPQVAGMDNKRFVISSEPEDECKLRMAMIKDLTGSSEISARKLFSNNCKVRMKCCLMFECNKKPKIMGRIDQSVMERVVDIPFVSHFTSDPDRVDIENHIYPVNTYYKENEFKQSHKIALFQYILRNAPKELYLPKIIVERSKNYVMDSDELYEWFKDNYEYTNDNNDILKMKDVYDLFRSSEFFQEKNKEEKRALNKKGFIEKVNDSLAFKGLYFNDQKTINKVVYNERIIKYKLKEKDEENNED